MDKAQLLFEIEEILRTAPSWEEFGRGDDDNFEWIGRAAAAFRRWDNYDGGLRLAAAVSNAQLVDTPNHRKGFVGLKALLHEARADLRMETGQLSVVLPQGQVFDYFDEVRKRIVAARSEVFFVDPYLDAEFVSRYLPHVVAGVGVRLLGGTRGTAAQKMATLLPAVGVFAQQSGMSIAVRSSDRIHDRYVFIDRAECYLSGASFKDGAKNAPAVLTQITDAFESMWTTYNDLWDRAQVER